MKNKVMVVLAFALLAGRPAHANIKEIVEHYEQSIDQERQIKALENIDQDLKEANAKSQ